jgi:hypothetical protein
MINSKNPARQDLLDAGRANLEVEAEAERLNLQPPWDFQARSPAEVQARYFPGSPSCHSRWRLARQWQ